MIKLTKQEQKTLALLKKYEGFKDTVYLDGKGIPTIGYGFTDPVLIKKGTISQADADARLLKEVRNRQKSLRDTLGAEKWDSLSDDSKAALTSYHYNYPAGFKDTTKFMTAWNSGNYDEAIRQVDAGMNDRKNPGLKPRRLEEQQLLRNDPFLNQKQAYPLDAYTFEKPQYESTWVPEQPIKTIYPLNNTVPSTISSWSGSDAPNATPRLPDFNEAMMNNRFNLQLPPIETLLSEYKDGKSPIHIKHPGRLTRLKARTGKSESELYNDGNPAHKKMVVFARNARKWKH